MRKDTSSCKSSDALEVDPPKCKSAEFDFALRMALQALWNLKNPSIKRNEK